VKEFEWVANLNKEIPGFKYYYMGWYVETCPKMRYKRQYQPFEVLCPINKVYVPYARCKQILRKHTFLPLVTDEEAEEIQKIRFQERPEQEQTHVADEAVRLRIGTDYDKYLRLVGPRLASRIVLRLA